MVRAARGCHDAALLFDAPFISGKDSLNNEFRAEGETIRIPHTLLVSAMGQVDDVTRCVTSDLKRAGNKLVLRRRNPRRPDADGERLRAADHARRRRRHPRRARARLP